VFVGFSRGACTAPSLPGPIRNCAIFREGHADQVDAAFPSTAVGRQPPNPSSIASETFRRMYADESASIHFNRGWDRVRSESRPIFSVGRSARTLTIVGARVEIPPRGTPGLRPPRLSGDCDRRALSRRNRVRILLTHTGRKGCGSAGSKANSATGDLPGTLRSYYVSAGSSSTLNSDHENILGHAHLRYSRAARSESTESTRNEE
jgi:hypothetical protein